MPWIRWNWRRTPRPRSGGGLASGTSPSSTCGPPWRRKSASASSTATCCHRPSPACTIMSRPSAAACTSTASTRRTRGREAKERLRLSPHPVNAEPYPERYKALAVYAYEQEKISEGQLARFLRCDRVTAREIVQEYLTSRDVNQDGQTEAVQFEQTQQ